MAFKVNRHDDRKFYIIKKLLGHLATDEDKLQGFIREGEIATALSHQNIVNGHEYDALEIDEETSYYLAMDYVFGKNLAQVIRKSPGTALPVKVVSSIIHSVANGLVHAHTYCDPLTLQEQSIVHKDISPDNIMLSYNGEVKITDFGISRKGRPENLSGKIAGKLSYMSPEQRQSRDLDCRSDMYSLGVVFWECLTGKKVFDDLGVRQKKDMVSLPDVVHPSEVNTDIPILIGDICMKCLELEPDNRFQSAKALRDALIECSDRGQFGTANVRNYLLQQYAEEFKNETSLLLQAQKASLNPNDALSPQTHKQTTAETELATNVSLAVLTNTDCSPTSVAEAPLVVFPDIPPSIYVEDAEQTAYKTMTDLDPFVRDVEQISEEKTVENVEESKEIDRANQSIPSQTLGQANETTMFSTYASRHNSCLNVLVNPNDATQTDYEIPTIVSSTSR